MGGGPPGFPQDFPCPGVLGHLAQGVHSPFAYGAITLYGQAFQPCSARGWICNSPASLRPRPARPRYPAWATPAGFDTHAVWAPPLSLAATQGIATPALRQERQPHRLVLLSFPGGTEMFHFPPFASAKEADTGALPPVGFPIRESPDHSLLAAPRGLSQLATPFIASRRQGIHRMPLVA